MKKYCVLLFLLFHISLFAGKIASSNGEYKDTNLTEAVNSQLVSIANKLNEDSRVQLTGNQTEFAKANGNANSAGTLNGNLYSGLDCGIATFAFSAGAAVTNFTKLDDITDDVNDGKDTYVGLATSGFGVSTIVNGDNISIMPIRGLMLEGKFSFFNNDNLAGTDIAYNSFLVGFGARYKLAAMPVQSSFLKMRALTAGAGLYYSQTDMEFESGEINKDEESTLEDGTRVQTESETKLNFKLSNKSLTIPLELVSSVRLFYLTNFIFGSGLDVVLGQTSVKVDSDSEITVKRDGVVQDPVTRPDLKLTDSETKELPYMIRYKVILGAGLNFGPARIEVPVAYYPSYGVSASLVVGSSF